MNTSLINVGYGNMIAINRIIAVINSESAPAKKIIDDADQKGLLIKCTQGRKTRSVIVTDSQHVILSAVQAETLANRLNSKDYLKDIDNLIEE